MNKNDIEAFKKELANYNYKANMLNALNERLDETYYDLEGVKAIRYDKAPGQVNMALINEKKFSLSKKIDELETEISRLSNDIMYIEDILASMENHDIRKAIIDIYINKKTIKEVCEDYFITPPGLLYQINKEIGKTLSIKLLV